MSQINGERFHGANDTSNGSSQGAWVDMLIVGTGPAGASLACFLAQHGLTGLIISQDPGSADTPRAHITNMAALDCLRDIGLDTECYAQGMKGDCMMHTRWSNSMTGEEYARIYSWGHDPNRKGDYELASPSEPLDLPQTLMEPILMRYATLNGFSVKWDTTFISFDDDPKKGIVTSTLADRITGAQYKIRSKYLFAADGARSPILQQLQIPLLGTAKIGSAINVLVEADLSHLMASRKGNLQWLLQPEKENPDFAWTCCLRMVKPWKEWLAILLPKPGFSERVQKTNEEYLECVRGFIGEETIPMKVLGVSFWAINEIAAEYYSKGNVFCLGDAVHRHPPNHGLGSNTCIQDAFNLAWKIAYVQRGKAGKELLDTYSVERQPVGQHVVTMANASLRNHGVVWKALGHLEPDLASRVAARKELSENSEQGRSRRAMLANALQGINREEHGLGIEMNQRYTSSAVFIADQGAMPTFDTDDLEYYHPTTYPGARLPHVWVTHKIPGKYISTIDLAGKTRFTLFTGIGGEGWKAAAKELSKELRIDIAGYSIGYECDYEDTYLRWAKLRDIEESGCILVRPDTFVAWRCNQWSEDGVSKLRNVLRAVLSLS